MLLHFLLKHKKRMRSKTTMWFFDLACLKLYTHASNVANIILHRVHSLGQTLIPISRDYHLAWEKGGKKLVDRGKKHFTIYILHSLHNQLKLYAKSPKRFKCKMISLKIDISNHMQWKIEPKAHFLKAMLKLLQEHIDGENHQFITYNSGKCCCTSGSNIKIESDQKRLCGFST